MIEKKWCYQPLPTKEEVEKLQSISRTPPIMTKLLWQKGLTTLAKLQSFFNPKLAQLHDPFQLRDMDKVVARLWRAIDEKSHICIYGDYDVDGTTSVALLYKALKQLGASQVSFYIPDREKEGYGLSSAGITYAIEKKVALLICVDCGTRAVDLLTRAATYGIESIICDHHEVGEKMPPHVGMLNPKQPTCSYPFKGLSACGIVFKLIQAMVKQRNLSYDLTPYLDLVALSIAADIVPIIGENRILMHHGLAQLNGTPRPGIQALMQKREQEDPFSVSDIVFGIAPFINAVGRMSHARYAVQLLLTETREEAQECVKYLVEQNTSRKKLDQEITEEALEMVASQPPKEGIVLSKKGWAKGIVGIVAARCVEEYHRPTIILAQKGETLTGSGRSIPGYNLYQVVRACAPLLSRYGGHAQAVGLTLPYKNLDAFTRQFEEKVRETLLPIHKKAVQKIDLPITLTELTPLTLHLLARMAPYGPSHQQPTFMTSPIIVHDYHIYQGKHVKIFFKEKGQDLLWDAIGFHMAPKFLQLQPETALAIAYKASIRSYQANQRIQLTLKDIQKA